MKKADTLEDLSGIVIPKNGFAPMLFLESINHFCGTNRFNVKEGEQKNVPVFVIKLKDLDGDTLKKIVEYINANI